MLVVVMIWITSVVILADCIVQNKEYNKQIKEIEEWQRNQRR